MSETQVRRVTAIDFDGLRPGDGIKVTTNQDGGTDFLLTVVDAAAREVHIVGRTVPDGQIRNARLDFVRTMVGGSMVALHFGKNSEPLVTQAWAIREIEITQVR